MKRFELTVTVQIQTSEELRLSEDWAVLLFKSIRELLINTAKHAETNEASMRLTQKDGTLRIPVHDQGIDFDPTVLQKSGSTKFGLLSIRLRMYTMGRALGDSLGQVERVQLRFSHSRMSPCTSQWRKEYAPHPVRGANPIHKPILSHSAILNAGRAAAF
jgi:nitrate/nitrite-specific signal transduction histidine kinase